MGNVLEKVTIEEYPVIEQIKNVMKEHGALNAMMSGSGPTVLEFMTARESKKSSSKDKRKAIGKAGVCDRHT